MIINKWWIRHRYQRDTCPIIIHNKSKSLEIIISKCPSIRIYKPSFYYALDYHGQVQTILQCFFRNLTKFFQTKIFYKTDPFLLNDGGTIAIDWAHISDLIIVETAPIVVIMHVKDKYTEHFQYR